MFRSPSYLQFLGCAVLALVSIDSLAQTCEDSSWGHVNLNGGKTFKVNYAGAAEFGVDRSSGTYGNGVLTDGGDEVLTDTQLIQATLLAAGVWNDHGNAGYFQFVAGTTTETDLPDTEAECITDGVDYSLIVFSTEDNSNTALTRSECGGLQFVVTLYPKYINTTPSPDATVVRSFGNRSQATSTPPNGDYVKDVAGVIVHELGHAQDLAHPSVGSEHCVMGGFSNDVRKRDLYEWDIFCNDEISAAGGTRAGSPVRVEHSSTGFSSPTAFSGSIAATKASGGITFDSTTVKMATAFHRGSSVSWDENADGTGYVDMSGSGYPSPVNSIGFQVGFFREDVNQTDRIFYSYFDDDGTDFVETASHAVRQGRSTNEFSSATFGYLYHCTAVSGGTCTSTDPVYSRGNLAIAYSESSARSVIAWTDEDHSGTGIGSDANQIKISIGYMDDDTLAIPNGTSLYTAVTPGVACKDNFSGAYDCIIVYVPISDMENGMRAARFSIGGTWPTHSISMDGTTYSIGWSTGNGLTAWWHHAHSKFFVGYRTTSAFQGMYVRDSSDGSTWSSSTSIGSDPITGPSAASAWNSSAMTVMPIVYVTGAFP